jgi:ribosomal protein S27AE
MLRKNKCPKCRSAKIAKVPGYAKSQSISVGILASSSVPVDRFVCLRCGFVEHWVESDEDLEIIAKKYADHDS